MLIHDGGIYIDSLLGVGDHVLNFLRDEENRKELKWRTMQLNPHILNESKNNKWMKANFERHRGNVLEPLLDMLRKGGQLEVPHVKERSDVEINFDGNQLPINYSTNGVQIFDLKTLPSSQEIYDRVMDTSRRVDINWWETEGARSSCDTARKSLDNAYQEMKDARSSCKKLSKSLHGVYNDLVEQDVL